MTRFLRCFVIPVMLACTLLQACSAAPVLQLPLNRLPLAKGQAVWIKVDRGSLDISGDESGAVELTGEAPQGQSVQATTEADGIHITSKAESRPFWEQGAPLLRLHVSIPNGTSVNVDSFDAAMAVHDFTGKMTIREVGGDIRVQDSQGVFAIQSNRGNVSVEATSGAVHLAGNYGLLSMTNTHGTSDASTIMGTVRFAGAISAGDQVSLETDHGPVEIQLGPASDVTVQMRTTSGVVTCMMPGLHYAGQACTGTLQAGLGQLKVRTVSGSATLKPLP